MRRERSAKNSKESNLGAAAARNAANMAHKHALATIASVQIKTVSQKCAK